jgi:hypothetical protein
MQHQLSPCEVYDLSRNKAKEEGPNHNRKKLRFLLVIFKRSGKLREGDDSTMERISRFVLSGTEHGGAHDMIAKLHKMANVPVGRVVIQWCPGKDQTSVVQCVCRTRSTKTNEWNPLLRLVVIVPRTNSFGPGNVMYDRSNLCFLNV